MKRLILIIGMAFVFFAIFLHGAGAETTCEVDGCNINIKIKMAFSGATDQQISDWTDDIESVWNGPDGFRVTGDCDCEVIFETETMKITNASQVNCNPPPDGYHCIMVTPWSSNPPYFYNSTGDKEYVVAYMGYNTQSPSQGGTSIDGWWSDQTNRATPDGGIYHDAAHEAGHMMGLDDKEGDGLMTHTSGEKAEPTQDNIDNVVKNVCGEDACPDHCCCGNGDVDRDKGEECDPFASPDGCESGEACCPVCCSCYIPDCDPRNGEFPSHENCVSACPQDSACYKNYQTGCWDCKGYDVVEEVPYTEDYALALEECPHSGFSDMDLETIRDFFNSNIKAYPQIAGMIPNERVNIYIEGFGSVSAVIEDSEITELAPGEIESPTLLIRSDIETVEGIMNGETDFLAALGDGRITIEGVGFFNVLRFAIANFLLSVWMLLGGA